MAKKPNIKQKQYCIKFNKDFKSGLYTLKNLKNIEMGDSGSFSTMATRLISVQVEPGCRMGALDGKVSKPLLWEWTLQARPVVNIHMPKDRVTGQHQGCGFVEFLCEEDADSAINIMNMIKLYGKPIQVGSQQKPGCGDQHFHWEPGPSCFMIL